MNSEALFFTRNCCQCNEPFTSDNEYYPAYCSPPCRSAGIKRLMTNGGLEKSLRHVIGVLAEDGEYDDTTSPSNNLPESRTM